jgi:phosphoglycolate phosphatase-like HAD superfamily hydrolase
VDTLRKVQAAGKNLHISIAADEVQHALAQLSARGLFIDASARSEDEARNLLRMAERWSVDRG